MVKISTEDRPKYRDVSMFSNEQVRCSIFVPTSSKVDDITLGWVDSDF